MTRHAAPETTGRRRVVLAPGRNDLIDAGFTAVLMVLALLGFRTTYSGIGWLIAAIGGVVLGIAIGHIAHVLRQPMIAVAAMTLAVFFLAGGALALRETAIAGVVPSGSTFSDLASASVHGWKDLLTTLPPVPGSGPLLVLPYLLGLLGSVAGYTLARRTRPSAAPVAAPTAVLAAVILLGTQTAAAQLLQGGVFAVVGLGWIAMRSQRRRPVVEGRTGRVARLITVAALLAIALGGAVLAGPHLPGASAHQRLVLRSYVRPPFDIGRYPSPLAGFRKYTKPPKLLWHQKLFTVTGLPGGTRMRIATMDSYDGLTWTAANLPGSEQSTADTFQRVGTEIDDPSTGTPASYTVTIDHGYSDVWLPDAGALTGLRFTGDDAAAHASYFRYNLATGTGVVPDELRPGDSYTARAVLPASPTLQPGDTVDANGGAVPDASFLHPQANEWAGHAGDPTARILALAKHLYRVGEYSDGKPPQEEQYLPGHSEARLLGFVNGAQIVGDDEQFAAAYALMINDLGTPARVVLGAVLPNNGVVEGQNVHAWVEVRLADGTWRTIPTSEFLNKNSHPHKQPPEKKQKAAGKVVPPPARSRPKSLLGDATDANSHSHTTTHHKKHAAKKPAPTPASHWLGAVLLYGGLPVLAIAALCALIIGIKGLRRLLRRRRGGPATRLVRGWAEIIDHARDLGTATPIGRTRREQAAVLAAHQVDALARAADAHVFGATPPRDADAEAYWADVRAARKRMSRQVGTWRRIRAALSLASLRHPHRPVGSTT